MYETSIETPTAFSVLYLKLGQSCGHPHLTSLIKDWRATVERRAGTLASANFQTLRFKFYFSYWRRGRSSITLEEGESKINAIKSSNNGYDCSRQPLLSSKVIRKKDFWNLTASLLLFRHYFLIISPDQMYKVPLINAKWFFRIKRFCSRSNSAYILC